MLVEGIATNILDSKEWTVLKQGSACFCAVRSKEHLSKGQSIIFSVFSLSSLITDTENFNSNQILKHKVFLNSHYDTIFSYELPYKQIYQTFCT